MADERHNFSQARTRLEEIVTQVRKKDTSLEKSLDLLEEGVRLANVCTELSDHSEWRTVVDEQAAEIAPEQEPAVEQDSDAGVELAASADAEVAQADDTDAASLEADDDELDEGDEAVDEPGSDTAEEPPDA